MTPLLLAVHRLRTPLFAGVLVVALASIVVALALPDGSVAARALALLPLLAVLTFGLQWLLAKWAESRLPEPETRVVQSPVEGRWVAMNSPATKVPSHGIRAYGQAYAIDLCHEPDESSRPAFGSGRAMRSSEDYPAFGQPVLAMVSGVVVSATDGQRDHRARSSRSALAYLMVEGALRELGGPRRIVGNHVTLRTDDGAYALVAHLQQGSVRVRPGESVRAGQVVGACGNSGNSSEPHVHAQLMDRASLWTARGVPMAFAGVRIAGSSEPADGLPANGEHLEVRPVADRPQ